MNPMPPGSTCSKVEVTNISSLGVWLLIGDKELFMFYENFPCFRDAPIGKICHVEQPTPGHFHWPELNVDLGIETIEHPDRSAQKAK